MLLPKSKSVLIGYYFVIPKHPPTLAFYSCNKSSMQKLQFIRRKYGKELLIDACNETELDIVADTLVLNFYSIILVEKGTGPYFLDTEMIELEPCSVLFIRPGQINKVNQALFSKGHFLFFEGDFLDAFFSDQNFIYKFAFFHYQELPSVLRLSPPDFHKLNDFAAELRRELHQLTQDSEHILRSIIYYLLVRLNQAYGKTYGFARATLKNPMMLTFLKSLDVQVKTQKKVASYAQDLGISRVQLNTLCQKYFSKTARQIIREKTMAEIKKEIKYSAKDFAEIAYEFSFSAPSHFSRFVKQMTDQTPKQLKDQLSNW